MRRHPRARAQGGASGARVTDWKAIGARIGLALAALTPSGARERIRAQYAAKFGVCQRCGEPLGGPSPSQICADCHLDKILERARGGNGGDA
jgi:hypothetical protein